MITWLMCDGWHSSGIAPYCGHVGLVLDFVADDVQVSRCRVQVGPAILVAVDAKSPGSWTILRAGDAFARLGHQQRDVLDQESRSTAARTPGASRSAVSDTRLGPLVMLEHGEHGIM
jgi:hypothetical protein